MRAHQLATFLALGLWQAAPVPRSPSASLRDGPFRLALALATGDWEDATFDCNGNRTGSTAVPTTSAGARFDFLADEATLRPTAVGGRWAMNNPSSYGGSLDRAFGGVQVAFEGSKFGMGIGVVRNPPSEEGEPEMGSFYARLGSRSGEHFQVDINPPSETPGTTGSVRVGIGFGKGLGRQANGFVGLAWGPMAEHFDQGVLQVDIGVPVLAFVDLLIRGNVGGPAHWAAGGGLWAVG